jgi:hypothetical protein
MPRSASPVEVPAVNYPGLKSVEAVSDHQIIMGFDNGEKRVFDITPLLTVGRFGTLASPEVFSKVRVSFDTVEWENGLDLDPECLYQQSKPLGTNPA